MKKFLSIILAAMLVIGMLPTAFAAVDEEGAITYSFIADSRRNKTTALETVEGVWGTNYKSYPTTPADAGANWAYHGTTAGAQYSAKYYSVITTTYTSTGNAAAGEWLAFRINVPESGKYTVSASVYRTTASTASADLYIAPLAGDLATQLAEDNTTTYGTVANGGRTGHAPFSSLSMPEDALVATGLDFNGSTGATEVVSGVEKELTAGDNVVLFNATAATAARITPLSITITPVEEAPKPTITVSPEEAEILVGESVTLTSTVANAAVTNPTVTYSTEDTDIVSVDENTGVVTGLKEGPATITATYTEDGTAYTADVTVTVLSATMTYKFYSAYTDADAPSDIESARIVTVESADGTKKPYTAYGTDRPWAYLGASGTASISTSDYVRIFNGYLSTGDLSLDNWVAFKIKVLKTASYSISGKAYLNSGSSGIVDMYIAPYAGSAFEDASTYSTVTDGTRTAGKTLDELNISDSYVGTTSMNSSTAGDADMVITDAKEVILREGTDYVLLFNQSADVKRTITPVSVTLTPHDIEPKVTITASPSNIISNGETATLTSTVTDSNGDKVSNPSVTYEDDGKGVVSVDGNTVKGLKAGTATITATATLDDGSVATGEIQIIVNAKTYFYSFSQDALTDAFWTAVGATNDGNTSPKVFYDKDGDGAYDSSYLNDYTYIDTAKSLKWAVTTLGGEFNSVLDSAGEFVESQKNATNLHKFGYLQLVGRKSLNHTDDADARAVLMLNVPQAGSYNITADTEVPAGGSGAAQGTEADIYIIPVSSVKGDITQAYLKTLPIVGRASSVQGEEDGNIGNYTFDAAGDYYMVFNFNSTNTAVSATGGKQFFNLESITLSEGTASLETPDSETGYTPSFMAAANISGVKLTVNGEEEATSLVHSVTRGNTVTLLAPEVEGYNFVGWMRGACNDKGKYSKFVDLEKDEDGTYSYEVWTNTYLTAVYEPEGNSDAPVVRFWNYDGSYLGEKPVSALDADNLPTASLIGHTFKEWWVANNKALDITKLTAAVTNAVAQYTANVATNIKVNGAAKDSLTYGKAVSCTDEGGNVTHWLRDGEIVSYDKNYIHYAWGSTNIYSSYATVTEKKPLVVLAKPTVDGAYMIEYEAPADYEIVEVGILFAASGTPTVRSKDEIYSSQRGTSRGQFAAAPSDESYTVARGYMIYTNATGDAYVIYSK